MTDESRPFRAEIEEILVNRSSTRFGKVAAGMKRGLSDAEMAQEAVAAGEPIRADSVAAVRRIVRLSLDDELVTAPSEAEEQANLFRELLNHHCSPGLLQHITSRLTRLQAVGPNVKLTPLGAGHLGANAASQREKLPPLCPVCNQFHSGECL
ncbi:hypothetical protein MMAN_54660 [Mycobacterium mantenii]|uniref:Uncharacterized protein n=1 Tax=Mycobacterium mantenii TaxID=560555 RepID=A0A1X0FSL2_MYCNT|nr:hypothetical protein [Mycobacterium mantenii]MCV7245733.1 hypothetical protein [Mycobacterium mantenii]ORB04771.1 hypothetical protein BST30_16460 [Mycobacterium mantenii]BBY41332.1 hypothetical protein MMAN_54660 [Mycobacterium mantenii]